MADLHDRKAHLLSCTHLLHSRIVIGPPASFSNDSYQGHNIKEFLELINTPYVCKIFGYPTGTDILSPEFVRKLIEKQGVTMIESQDYPHTLNGFVVFGHYLPADDGDPFWPKFKDKKMPPNAEIVEIKLIGCRKGFGRIMFSWALLAAELPGKSVVVLELLGATSNRIAYEFYRLFGFEQKIAYDPVAGPFTQIRNDFDQICYIMGLFRKDGYFIDPLNLPALVNVTYIKKNGSEENPLNPKSPNIVIEKTLVPSSQNEARKSEEIEKLISLFENGFIMEEEFLSRRQMLQK